MVEDGFEDRAGVVNRKADPEREERREKKDLLHPGLRVQFALCANVEDGY